MQLGLYIRAGSMQYFPRRARYILFLYLRRNDGPGEEARAGIEEAYPMRPGETGWIPVPVMTDDLHLMSKDAFLRLSTWHVLIGHIASHRVTSPHRYTPQ
jgi:hypothetical protein